MIDKIKVNLSRYVYYSLLDDMGDFGFYKPNGDFNRNLFLNLVIVNFHTYKEGKRNEILRLLKRDAIPLDVSVKDKEKILNAAAKIIDNFYFEDINSRYHPYFFMVYPTQQTQCFFDELFENEIKHQSSLSSYVRQILNEYAYFPHYLKERIVKMEEYNKLCLATDRENVVSFDVSGQNFRVAPYIIETNIEETFNYLMGINLMSQDKSPISIKLSKINNVVISKSKYRFNKQEIKKLNNILLNGLEYASGEIMEIQIRFSKSGLKMAKYKNHNRPNMKIVSGDIYLVSCSLGQFLNYFIPFGKEVKIMNNEDIKNRMLHFYKNAFEAFDK